MARRRRKRSGGSGSIWTKAGNTWIQWRENGRRRSRKFPGVDIRAREAAELALRKITLNIARGEAGLEGEGDDVPVLAVLSTKWLARREHTHRSWRDDQNRWNRHLKPTFGHLRPREVDQAAIRRLVEAKLVEGLSPQSVGNVVRCLSTFFTDLIEQGHATSNPARGLPRSTKRLIKSTHDPRQTPFIDKHVDIGRIYANLGQPFATMFAVGALAGLRPGEIIGLQWGDVDIGARRILVQRQVRHGKVGPTKSGKPRLVPIIEPLAKILAEWKLATGGEGQLFQPLNNRRVSRFIAPESMIAKLRSALEACGLPKTWTWYNASRHTYAAQHVMGGGSLATLREILGHSSVTVTERYAHLRPDLFRAEDLIKLSVPMSRDGGTVHDLAVAREGRAAGGNPVATEDAGDPTRSEVTS